MDNTPMEDKDAIQNRYIMDRYSRIFAGIIVLPFRNMGTKTTAYYLCMA